MRGGGERGRVRTHHSVCGVGVLRLYVGGAVRSRSITFGCWSLHVRVHPWKQSVQLHELSFEYRGCDTLPSSFPPPSALSLQFTEERILCPHSVVSSVLETGRSVDWTFSRVKTLGSTSAKSGDWTILVLVVEPSLSCPGRRSVGTRDQNRSREGPVH